MNILHISNYAPPHIGGIEQTAKDIIDSVPKEHRQRLFCFNDKRKTIEDELSGVPVTRCGSLIKISSQELSLVYGKKLKRVFREFEPELTIFHFPNPFAAHYLLKRLKKSSCKLVVWWHLDITKQKILGKLFKGQTKRLLKRADKIVATSPNYIEGSPFLTEFRGKCVVIPSCIERARLQITPKIQERIEEIRKSFEGKLLFFALGRHVAYKGYSYLIEAAKRFHGEGVFLIGGTGELTESLKKQAEGEEKIRFLGALSEEDACAYLHACDVFCFPSVTKNEAFGLALAEAMACGKPSVTFTIEGSGVNFVSLKDVTGLEVENKNVEAYAEALERLKEDDLRLSLGTAAKFRAEAFFSKEAFRENVKSLL